MRSRIDRLLNDVQVSLIGLANEIQKQREFLMKANGTKKERKEANLERVANDLAKAFKELGYDKTTN